MATAEVKNFDAPDEVRPFVLAVPAGEAALFGSPLLIWFAAFFAANHVGFRLYEEPGLERRFGEDYRAYKRNVPRWLPRHDPWVPPRP